MLRPPRALQHSVGKFLGNCVHRMVPLPLEHDEFYTMRDRRASDPASLAAASAA
jgi:hypothetical protein